MTCEHAPQGFGPTCDGPLVDFIDFPGESFSTTKVLCAYHASDQVASMIEQMDHDAGDRLVFEIKSQDQDEDH